MKSSFAASVYLVPLLFLVQSLSCTSLLYPWCGYLLTYKVKAVWFVVNMLQASRCLTSYQFQSGMPIFFVDMGIRMWCLLSRQDTHIHRKYRHRDAHICINIGIGVPIFAWKWASGVPIFRDAYFHLTPVTVLAELPSIHCSSTHYCGKLSESNQASIH